VSRCGRRVCSGVIRGFSVLVVIGFVLLVVLLVLVGGILYCG